MADPDFSFLGGSVTPAGSPVRPPQRRERGLGIATICVAVCGVVIWGMFMVAWNPFGKVAKWIEPEPPARVRLSEEDYTRKMLSELLDEYQFMCSSKAPRREVSHKCREIAECYKKLRDSDNYAKFKERERVLRIEYEPRGSFGTQGF